MIREVALERGNRGMFFGSGETWAGKKVLDIRSTARLKRSGLCAHRPCSVR
jgi:hypothetical protein